MPLESATRRVLESVADRAEHLCRWRAVQELSASGLSLTDESVALPEDAGSPLSINADVVLGRAAQQGVPELLTFDTWELLWSELTEELIQSERIRLDGLGDFEIKEAKGTLKLEFRPSPALQHESCRVIGEHGTFGPSVLATVEVVTGLEVELEVAVLALGATDLLAGANYFSAITLVPVIEKVIQQTPGLEAATVAALGAAGFVPYYGIIWTTGRLLRHGHQVVIPLIGTFATENGGVTFKPATEFLELLAANHPVTA
jgi:hypothetical protein